MAQSPEVTNMALFCDFENIALGVQDAKYDKAVDACDVAIRTYPNGDKIAEAYYRKGVALSQMRDTNGARTAWEQAAKLDPDGAIGRLAKQGLDRLRRP